MMCDRFHVDDDMFACGTNEPGEYGLESQDAFSNDGVEHERNSQSSDLLWNDLESTVDAFGAELSAVIDDVKLYCRHFSRKYSGRKRSSAMMSTIVAAEHDN